MNRKVCLKPQFTGKARRFILLALLLLGLILWLSDDELSERFSELPDPGCLTAKTERTDDLDIEIWYGDRQSFGLPGVTQRWVNVLGNIASRSNIQSLTYSLNEGVENHLTIGPDRRRLACPGDFNIEIDYHDLRVGENDIIIRAHAVDGQQVEKKVILDYRADSVWPLPYTITWGDVAGFTDVLDVVDGRWVLESAGVRPATISYDRTLAIGDLSWENYEVTFQFMLHRIVPQKYPSNGAGLGVLSRWQGFSDEPVLCEQPHCGWWNFGGAAFYSWDEKGNPAGLNIEGFQGAGLAEGLDYELRMKTWYTIKLRAQTDPPYDVFQLKLWESAMPEPEQWTLVGRQEMAGPRAGSVLLVAHNVDLTFGDLVVIPLP